MIKKKSVISGKIISSNTIEVDVQSDSQRPLVPGQKVLVYKPTSRIIVNALGKEIGNKENILAYGVVRIKDNKKLVSIDRGAHAKHLIAPARVKFAGCYRKVEGTQRTRCNNGHGKRESITKVFLKPIDE